jgi:4-amino-4-deoxy-L-arabinose transferase-like glycosyltransferase
MPLYTFVEVPWYGMFGFSLVTQRLLTVVFGGIVLWCLYLLVKKLSTPWAATIALMLLCCDFEFIRLSADARMDMMCAALGLAALAIYVHLRETRLRSAVLLANAAAAGSCMTHPCGFLPLTGLWFLMFYLDRRRLRLADLAVGATPYVVVLALWGAYISRAPAEFMAQMRGNGNGVQADIGGRSRFGDLSNPLKAFSAEIHIRYFASYHSHMVPICYFIGLAAIVYLAWRTRQKDHVIFAVLGVLYFFELMLLDGLKSPMYLDQPLPILAAAVAIALCSVKLRSRLRTGIVIGLAVGLMLGRQALTFYHFGNDAEGSRAYFAAADLVAANHARGEEVIASSELAYKLGLYNGVDEDWRIGYTTGKKPEFIVLGRLGRAWLKQHKNDSPDFSRFVDNRLNQEYVTALENKSYTVYVRRDLAGSLNRPSEQGWTVARAIWELRPQT